VSERRSRGGVVGRLALVLTTAVFAIAFSGAPAMAHSQLESTSPVDGAVLDAPPAEVVFTFDDTLLDDTDTISINDENGNVVKSIHPKPEGASVSIPWPEGTAPGMYQVAYRVVCGDGHPVTGAILLTINGTAPATAAAFTAGASTGAAAEPSSAPSAASSAAASGVAATAEPGSAAPAAEAAQTPPPASGSALPLIATAAILLAAVVAVVAALVMRRRGTPTAA
jgi:methionine-rich copper-binding protein CopC